MRAAAEPLAPPSARRRVLFVGVTPTQLALWAEVINSTGFDSANLEPSLLLLERAAGDDRLVALAAALLPACRTLTLPAVLRGAPRPTLASRVAARLSMFGALGAAVAAAFDALDPAVCVVGNDCGYAERLVVREARRRGRASLLLQDGLFARRPPAGLRGRLRAGADRVLRAAGLAHFASGRYGHGGCDLIGLMGPRWQELLAAEGVERGRIRVVGNALYERGLQARDGSAPEALRRAVGLDAAGRLFTYFTTSILTELSDRVAHARQLEEIAALAALLERRYGAAHHLIVKLHPLDRAADHAALAGPRVTVRPDGDPAALVLASELVFTSFSAIALEASLLDRICLIPARFLGASPCLDVMRGLGLPLLSTEAALDAALGELASPEQRAARLAELRERAHGLVVPGGGAAGRCAALIAQLGDRCASS